MSQFHLPENLTQLRRNKGITQEKFEREYAQLELFQKIYAYIQNSGGGVSREEKRWFVWNVGWIALCELMYELRPNDSVGVWMTNEILSLRLRYAPEWQGYMHGQIVC